MLIMINTIFTLLKSCNHFTRTHLINIKLTKMKNPNFNFMFYLFIISIISLKKLNKFNNNVQLRNVEGLQQLRHLTTSQYHRTVSSTETLRTMRAIKTEQRRNNLHNAA